MIKIKTLEPLVVNRPFKAIIEIGRMPIRVLPRRSLIWLARYRLLQAYLRGAKQRELAGTAMLAKARLLQEGVLPERRQAAGATRDPA